MPADSELLRLYSDTRSEAAFSQLVNRHLNTVYAAAFRRLGGDAHHAADVSSPPLHAMPPASRGAP